MVPLEIAGLVIAALVSTGALAYFMKFSTRMAMTERDSVDALKLARELKEAHLATTGRVTTLEATLAEIKASLSKLVLIDEINARLISLKERMEEKYNVIVPRAEVDARFANTQTQIDNLKSSTDDRSGR